MDFCELLLLLLLLLLFLDCSGFVPSSSSEISFPRHIDGKESLLRIAKAEDPAPASLAAGAQAVMEAPSVRRTHFSLSWWCREAEAGRTLAGS